MKIEVAKNAKRNIVVGFFCKIVLLMLPFAVRTIITIVLGTEYLGLTSLFSSIIQVLSLTELGFSSALVYHMYDPIAQNDTHKINALLNLYKKAYTVIGVVVLCIGGLITPFLTRFINGDCPSNVNIYVLFTVYVLNSSISYFLYGYKQSLLVAYQREDINSLINITVQVGLQAAQMILLSITRNYYTFVFCMPIFTLLNNLWIGKSTRKRFPDLHPEGRLDKNCIDSIKQLVAGTFIQRACELTRNSLDSICISTFLGLTLTAIYNNYYMLMAGVTSVLLVVYTSLAGGIGNHVSLKSVEDNYEEFDKINFMYMTISGVSTSCFVVLYQPFMKVWMGNENKLPMGCVCLICSYFYLLKTGDMMTLYSRANGLAWKHKYRAISETVLNIVLNIVLGKNYGVYGIIVATIVSYIICNFFWASFIIFDSYFGRERLLDYFLKHFKYFACTFVVCYTCYFVTNNFIVIMNEYVGLVVKLAVTVGISIIVYLAFYWKSGALKDAVKFIKK